MGSRHYADGRSEERQPENGRDFQLKELQEIVGGYIEIVPTKDGRIMVCNEEGKLDDIIFVGEITDTEVDYIAGDVLVCESSELK